jgi:hypothetical protein
MSNKKKNKVPKSDKTRLSDLTPQKQARGGGAAPTPPGQIDPKPKPGPTPPFETV